MLNSETETYPAINTYQPIYWTYTRFLRMSIAYIITFTFSSDGDRKLGGQYPLPVVDRGL